MNTLDVSARQTWHSWDRLAGSTDVLAGLPVEWVVPGRGMWHHVEADQYRDQMAGLGAMRQMDDSDPTRGWGPHPFGWSRRDRIESGRRGESELHDSPSMLPTRRVGGLSGAGVRRTEVRLTSVPEDPDELEQITRSLGIAPVVVERDGRGAIGGLRRLSSTGASAVRRSAGTGTWAESAGDSTTPWSDETTLGVHYVGTPPLLSALVVALERDGLRVERPAIVEVSDTMVDVALSVGKPTANPVPGAAIRRTIELVVEDFSARFPRVTVEIAGADSRIVHETDR